MLHISLWKAPFLRSFVSIAVCEHDIFNRIETKMKNLISTVVSLAALKVAVCLTVAFELIGFLYVSSTVQLRKCRSSRLLLDVVCWSMQSDKFYTHNTELQFTTRYRQSWINIKYLRVFLAIIRKPPIFARFGHVLFACLFWDYFSVAVFFIMAIA
jgi:hypothetical protein